MNNDTRVDLDQFERDFAAFSANELDDQFAEAVPALIAELRQSRRVVEAVADGRPEDEDNDMGAISFYCRFCHEQMAQKGVHVDRKDLGMHLHDCPYVVARKLTGRAP